MKEVKHEYQEASRCSVSFKRKGKDMKYYLGLVTDNPNHNHEMHKESCSKLPASGNREFLGLSSTSQKTLDEAKRRHPSWNDIDGCNFLGASSPSSGSLDSGQLRPS